MATEKTDVVIVGVGGTGGILAAELSKAGMKVIGLERGPRHRDRGFRRPGRIALFPAPGPAPEPEAPAGHLAAERERARGADVAAQLRQPGRRRHRPLRRSVVALPRDRFPRALADHRALWRRRDPGGLLGHRLAAELWRSRALLRSRRVRSRRVRQGRQPAGPQDRRRQRLRGAAAARVSAAAACSSTTRPASSKKAPRSSAITRSRRRAPSSRRPTRVDRAALIAASARRTAATSARSPRCW